MYRAALLTGFCALALAFFAPSAQAEDGNAGVSYAKKKQGMVHFVDKEDGQDEASNAADPAAPQNVEPAAGAEESEPQPEDNKAAEMIHLPRK